jgi:hypothetical protein
MQSMHVGVVKGFTRDTRRRQGFRTETKLQKHADKSSITHLCGWQCVQIGLLVGCDEVSKIVSCVLKSYIIEKHSFDLSENNRDIFCSNKKYI